MRQRCLAGHRQALQSEWRLHACKSVWRLCMCMHAPSGLPGLSLRKAAKHCILLCAGSSV